MAKILEQQGNSGATRTPSSSFTRADASAGAGAPPVVVRVGGIDVDIKDVIEAFIMQVR